MEALESNKTGQEDIGMSKRRLSMGLDGPARISLFSEKKTPERKITTRGLQRDPVDFIDASFDIPRSHRRRTIQRDEIINSQPENDDSSQQNQNRKRPALDHEIRELELFNSTNTPPVTKVPPEQKDREIMFMKEKISLLQTHLEDMVEQYEDLKNIRSTEQEAALANHLEWAQVKDNAYITLRDQIEELCSQSKTLSMYNMGSRNTSNDETQRLRARVANLERELEQRNAEDYDRNKMLPGQDSQRSIYDMYEELTGVVVTDMKKGERESIYKCLITGKLGTFQFSLSISNEKNGLVFYWPILDQQRDAKLVSALPEFLKETVEFDKDVLRTFFNRLFSIMNS